LRTGEAAIATAAIVAESRTPGALLRPGPQQDQPRFAEIHGREGPAFQLRALSGVGLTEGAATLRPLSPPATPASAGLAAGRGRGLRR
jgi:hypothetical protein